MKEKENYQTQYPVRALLQKKQEGETRQAIDEMRAVADRVWAKLAGEWKEAFVLGKIQTAGKIRTLTVENKGNLKLSVRVMATFLQKYHPYTIVWMKWKYIMSTNEFE